MWIENCKHGTAWTWAYVCVCLLWANTRSAHIDISDTDWVRRHWHVDDGLEHIVTTKTELCTIVCMQKSQPASSAATIHFHFFWVCFFHAYLPFIRVTFSLLGFVHNFILLVAGWKLRSEISPDSLSRRNEKCKEKMHMYENMTTKFCPRTQLSIRYWCHSITILNRFHVLTIANEKKKNRSNACSLWKCLNLEFVSLVAAASKHDPVKAAHCPKLICKYISLVLCSRRSAR